MRIAIYTNAYKPIISGVVNAISLFRQGLLALGHEVVVMAPDYYGYRDQEPAINRFPSLDLVRSVRFPVAIPWSPRMSRVIRNFAPDLIHCHHPFVLGPLAMRMARVMGVPLVYTFHTQYEQYAHYVPLPQNLVKTLTRWRIRTFVNQADAVTTPAASVRDLLYSYGVTCEVNVLPNPVDLSRFSCREEGGTVRHQLGLAAEDVALISVGRIGVEKNLGFMLEAFALMLSMAEDLPLKLVLVGSGPEEARLVERAAELGLGNRLIMAGSVPYQAIPSYLAAADLFLMTSVSEVKPLVLLEAMASGLPIVAVRASGAMDTVTDGCEGLLVQLNQEDFARSTVGLLRDKERLASMSERARDTADRYALSTVTEQLVRVYEDALSKKCGRRNRPCACPSQPGG